MKILFAVLLCVLCAAAAGTYVSFPDTGSDVPVIYWVTDRNPARELQVETFHKWLVKQGHVTGEGTPKVELRLDMANRDISKQIIQSVSGVGGDLMDIGGGNLPLFEAMGIVTDVTDAGVALGFDPSQTYRAIGPEITVDGRQYMFPCNVAMTVYWVNSDTFAAVNMPVPPTRWTLEEFEAIGKEFVRRANPPGTRPDQKRFLANDVNLTILHRSLGLSVFNETLTACDLDDPRYARVLGLKRRWIYEDNFLPTPDDADAFATQQGYGGAMLALFGSGNYAMVSGGRWYLIRFREFDNLGPLKVVEPPHGGFPNTTIGTRAAVLYAGSAHPDLARLFLSYLASEDYNSLIVHDADALPPNPRYTQSEAFLRPPDHPNEWGAHGEIVRQAEEIAIAGVYSPFVLPSVVSREANFFMQDFMAYRCTAEEAAARSAAAINRAIQGEVQRKPELQAEYDRRLALQQKIDQRLASGRKLPPEWISNVFYLRYYADQGMLLEPGSPDARETP